MSVTMTRRGILGGLAATGATGLVGIGDARGTPALVAAYPSMLKFRVERDGSFVGHVMERYSPSGDDLMVDVFIAFQVKLAFITVYRYEHRAREVWREGRLVRLDTVTNDDGAPESVRGRATGDGLSIDGPVGSFVAPQDIFPSSYWHPRFPEQSRMLDSQKGRVLEFTITKVAKEQVRALGMPVDTDRFAVRGDIDLDVWYDAERVWQKMAFTIKGGHMEYTRVEPGPGDMALFGTPLSTGAALPSLASA